MTNTCGGRLNNTVVFFSRNELSLVKIYFNYLFYQKAKDLQKTKLQPLLFFHLIHCSGLAVNMLIITVAE